MRLSLNLNLFIAIGEFKQFKQFILDEH